MPQSIRKTIEKDVFAETLNNPRIVQDSFMDAGQKVTWDCIYFGSYPQTEIVDTPKPVEFMEIHGWKMEIMK